MKTTIQTATLQTWAASILELVREYTVLGGKCIDGSEYGLNDFLCDTWGGRLPMNEAKYDEVVRLMEADPTFADTMTAFQAKFGVDFMYDGE